MKRVMHRAAAGALLVLAGCAARGTSGEGGGATRQEPAEAPAATGGGAHAHAADEPRHAQPLPATAGPGYTVADVRFMQDMIGHHAQALVMAALAPSHGAGERLRKLAEKIDISQRDEIAFMKDWLTERGQPVPDEHHAHTHPMPGMLTPEELARLDAARGVEFERLFLTFMMRHHEGALQMVEALFATPGAAQDSDLFRFVTDVDADQRDEIFVMSRMLDTLGANREG